VNGKSSRRTQSCLERRSQVPLSAPDLEKVRSTCFEEGWNENDFSNLKSLCTYVHIYGVFGASKKDLRMFETEGVKKLSIEEVLKCGLKFFLILKVGVVEERYVAYDHCREWLLHSFQLNRSNEEVGSVKFAGKLYQGHGALVKETGEQESPQDDVNGALVKETGEQENTKDDVKDKSDEKTETDNESVGSRVRRRSGERPRRGSLDDNIGGEDIRCNALWKNPQVGAKMSREVQEACEKINWGSVKEVLVTIRPWIRVDGTLNRRVLDRLLGSMLGVVMQLPGQTMSMLLARFSPAIQPAHSKELVTLLAELGCVEILRLCKAGKPSLFSKPATVTLEQPSMLDADTDMVVEAMVDAVVRLGMFIGDKVYHTDFACQCPCHPDRRM